MKNHCPECHAPWPVALRKPEKSIICLTCLAEKRSRMQARCVANLDTLEARAAASKARWDALSPEQREAEAKLAKEQLWASTYQKLR